MELLMSFFKKHKKKILTLAAAAAVVGSGGAVVQYTQGGLAVLQVLQALDSRIVVGPLKPEDMIPAPTCDYATDGGEIGPCGGLPE
jgi:hypothetical protein